MNNEYIVITKEEALKKIEELKQYIDNLKEDEFVTIDYSVIEKELFEKYNVKPFKIAKRKMRGDDGEVLCNINYFEAMKEAEKRGGRLPNIREMLLLLEVYKEQNKEVSCYDKEFLGIEELSYNEDVCFEWIEALDNVGFLRGGYWNYASSAGAFLLYAYHSASYSHSNVGGRLVKDI